MIKMFQYDAKMNKVPMSFVSPGKNPVVEHYSDSDDDSKCPTWLWWTLGAVAVVLLVAAVVMFMRSRKRKESYTTLPVRTGSPSANMSFGNAQRFGFRFF